MKKNSKQSASTAEEQNRKGSVGNVVAWHEKQSVLRHSKNEVRRPRQSEGRHAEGSTPTVDEKTECEE